MAEPPVPNRAAQGAQDVVGIVVGAVDVVRLAVAAKVDRARPFPGAEVREGPLEIGVRLKPQPAGVIGGSQNEVVSRTFCITSSSAIRVF